MTINELIGKGKIKDAIEKLLKLDDRYIYNQAALLLGRYNANMRSSNLGIIERADFNLERNRIVQAVLSLAEECKIDTDGVAIVDVSEYLGSDKKINEKALLAIIKKNKRRRVDISNKARSLLTDLRAYQDNKKSSPIFDRSKRRFILLDNRFIMLRNELKEQESDAIEDISSKIEELLEGIPTYKKLGEAYDLVSGRGFSDPWIVEQLGNQPNDDMTRIDIAERIENYAGSIEIV